MYEESADSITLCHVVSYCVILCHVSYSLVNVESQTQKHREIVLKVGRNYKVG